MGGVLHSGVDGGASFELERLERDDGRLLVSGWWFGVRGIRFVRPALVVDGRQVLATLDDKPWPLRDDGAWSAAFPWKDDRPLDIGEVTLVVAPSVEVPLDAEAPVVKRAPRPVAVVAPDPPAPVEPAPARALRAIDETESLREELRTLELRLDETRERADRRDARCRELEHVAARERRAAQTAESERDAAVRAEAIAIADRDRMAAQHEEAVADREAAMRARKRMLTQRDEATMAREVAEAERDRALAQRDELRMARDEALLAHRALRDQLRGERAQADRERAAAAEASGDLAGEPLGAATLRGAAAGGGPAGDVALDAATVPGDAAPPRPASGPTRQGEGATGQPPALRRVRPARVPLRRDDAAPGADDEPIGVRTIPAARQIAAHLHRAQRVREHGITAFDLWVARILGTVAAVCFLALLIMVLKAFFAF